MPQYTKIPLAVTLEESRSGAASLERVLNLYAETNKRERIVLYPRPGCLDWVTGIGSGAFRGMRTMGALLYVAVGGALYTVNTAGVVTEIGALAGVGPVRMTDNGTHVLTATSTRLYASNATTHLELSFSYVNGVGYVDGYGLMTQNGTEIFQITNVDDFTTISALDFTSMDRSPDFGKGLLVDNGRVYGYGQSTIEVYTNQGTTFPFVRVDTIQYGTKASGSLAIIDGLQFFLGHDGRVYSMRGVNPQPISTPSIERFIETSTSPEAAEAFAFHQGGHSFYVLSLAEGTRVFNTSSQTWSEWKTHGKNRWRAFGYAFFNAKHLVGDFETGNIYELDFSTYDDSGDVIRREIVLPPLEAESPPATLHEVRVGMEKGVGLVNGQGSNPLLMLDWSEDDGKTWINERTASIGKIGEYGKTIQFNALGSFYDRRHLRLSVTDPVKTVFESVRVRMEGATL